MKKPNIYDYAYAGGITVFLLLTSPLWLAVGSLLAVFSVIGWVVGRFVDVSPLGDDDEYER